MVDNNHQHDRRWNHLKMNFWIRLEDNISVMLTEKERTMKSGLEVLCPRWEDIVICKCRKS